MSGSHRDDGRGHDGLPEVWGGPADDGQSAVEPLPDVWQGPALEDSLPSPAVERPGQDPRAEIAGATVADGGVVYGGAVVETDATAADGGDDPDAVPVGDWQTVESKPARPPVRRPDELEQSAFRPSPATVLTSHVIVPAATIGMVSALLFYLFDLRSVFLPGADALKWVGFCFASATVLIARYGRTQGEPDSTSGYSSLLAVVTVLTMALSPWEAPGVGFLGPLSNGLIIFGVWKFAYRLTERLSVDLDRPVLLPPHLYGLERLEMERFRRQDKDRPTSIYDIGRQRRQPLTPADGEKAFRDVVRLVLLGILIFALGEPILLAGPPDVAQRALADMLIFLLAAAVVLAAASTVQATQRLRSIGAQIGLGGVATRVLAASLLMALVLALGLATPGLRVEGSGRIQPMMAQEGKAAERGQGDARERQEIEQEGEADASSEESPEETDQEAEEGDPSTEAADGSEPTPPVLEAFASVGQWLKWPAILLLAIAVAILLWKQRALVLGAIGRFVGSLPARAMAILARVGALVGALWNRIFGGFGRGRSGSSGSKVGKRAIRDPFADLPALAGFDPRTAVLEAYGRMLAMLERIEGEARPEATPMEILQSWPGRARSLRPAAERLTRAYLEAAYAPRGAAASERAEGLRRAALDALGEMRAPAERLFAELEAPSGPR